MRPRFEQNIAGFREEIERMDEATEEEEKMQLEQGQKLRPELEEKLNISAGRRDSHAAADARKAARPSPGTPPAAPGSLPPTRRPRPRTEA